MILFKLFAPIISILAKLLLGVTEDLMVAKNKYYHGSKLEGGLEKAINNTRDQRVMVKCYAKGFVGGLNTPVRKGKRRH